MSLRQDDLDAAVFELLTPQMALASLSELLQESCDRCQPNTQNLAALLSVISSHMNQCIERVSHCADVLQG